MLLEKSDDPGEQSSSDEDGKQRPNARRNGLKSGQVSLRNFPFVADGYNVVRTPSDIYRLKPAFSLVGKDIGAEVAFLAVVQPLWQRLRAKVPLRSEFRARCRHWAALGSTAHFKRVSLL